MEKTQEKKYLKWYHKVGYGSGDIAGNCVYQLLTPFSLHYFILFNYQRYVSVIQSLDKLHKCCFSVFCSFKDTCIT